VFARPDWGRFGDVWPQVSRRLQRTLMKRGTPPADAEDLVQETAVRALQAAVPFDSADDLFGWSLVVARRLAIDAHRRHRLILDVDVPDRAGPHIVDRQVEARLSLEAVAAALAELSPRDRRALLAVVDGTGDDRREAVRINVQRHRARARLRVRLGELLER
jgi:RNA polymerase sigma factor (sigma-70 family)